MPSAPRAEFFMRPDGILVAREVETTEAHSAETAQSDFDAISASVGSARPPAMWDVRGMARPSPTAWSVLIERVADLVSAVAVLIDPSDDNVGHYPATIDSLLLPMRTFTDEDEAIDWLKSLGSGS